MSEKNWLDNPQAEDEKEKPIYYKYGYGPYNQFKTWKINTCLKCDNQFKFKVYEYDDSRFVRFCNQCRSVVKSGNHDVDFTETVGN